MRPIRFGLGLILALGLSVGLAAASFAQDDPMAPTAVLGWALDESWVADADDTETADMLQRRGSQWSYTITSDDPRLQGDALWVGNGNRYASEPMFEVQSATWQIDGGAGGWTGMSTAIIGNGMRDTDTAVLAGTGANEGLTAYLVFTWSRAGASFIGAIFPGVMPPSP